MIIRKETPEDIGPIRDVNISAFKVSHEADLIESIRKSATSLLSLVAEQNGQVVGHILFSPVRLDGSDKKLVLYGLGPMAVMPEWQKQGIGSRLVSDGLKRSAESGVDAVVVLGHPDFYPRFGFKTSRIYGIESEYNVPDNFFMVIELENDCLKGTGGTIKYHDAFNAV